MLLRFSNHYLQSLCVFKDYLLYELVGNFSLIFKSSNKKISANCTSKVISVLPYCDLQAYLWWFIMPVQKAKMVCTISLCSKWFRKAHIMYLLPSHNKHSFFELKQKAAWSFNIDFNQGMPCFLIQLLRISSEKHNWDCPSTIFETKTPSPISIIAKRRIKTIGILAVM